LLLASLLANHSI